MATTTIVKNTLIDIKTGANLYFDGFCVPPLYEDVLPHSETVTGAITQ